MERLKNLGYTEAQISEAGDVWEPELGKPPLEMNQAKWRILRKIIRGSDPLEVRVLVFREPIKAGLKPVLELVTLIEDLEWMGE